MEAVLITAIVCTSMLVGLAGVLRHLGRQQDSVPLRELEGTVRALRADYDDLEGRVTGLSMKQR